MQQCCFTLFNLTCKSAEIILRPWNARLAVHLIVIGRYYGVMHEIRFVDEIQWNGECFHVIINRLCNYNRLREKQEVLR